MLLRVTITSQADAAKVYKLVDEPHREEGIISGEHRPSCEAVTQWLGNFRAAHQTPTGRELRQWSFPFVAAPDVTHENFALTSPGRAFLAAWKHIHELTGLACDVTVEGDDGGYNFLFRLVNAHVRRVELIRWQGIWIQFAYQLEFERPIFET